MPRKVEIQQSDDYTDDDPYEITYTDGKSTRHKVTEQQMSDLHIRVNDNFVMLKWMFLAHGCSLVILISLVILFTTRSSFGEPADTSQTDNMTLTASVSVTTPMQENCELCSELFWFYAILRRERIPPDRDLHREADGLFQKSTEWWILVVGWCNKSR